VPGPVCAHAYLTTLWGAVRSALAALLSDVNKDWTCKDKDFTYGYLLQVAAKPTIAIKQQQ